MGREGDLKRLHKELNNHRKVNIVGMFGLGKTELALQYARAHAADDYPGGVTWFGAATFGADLSKWVQAELYPEQDLRHLDLEQQVTKAWKEWRDFCGQRPALVIVDDVTDYRQQVAPYLPANEEVAAPFRFVFTSHSPVANLESFRLPQLTLEAARQLLERLAGATRIGADAATAEAISQRLGYLPLALTLVGSWLNVDPDRTVADLQQALEDNGLNAPALDRDPNDVLTAERNIKTAFAISWDDLQRRSPDGAQLARVLTLFAPVDVPWHLIEAVVATYDQEYVAPTRATPVARPKPRGWRNLWQNFWGWLRQLFRRPPTPTRSASAPVYPVSDPLEARGQLLRLSLLERVRSAADKPGESAYRLHPLLRELFAAQWGDCDQERWELAWALGMAAMAAQVPNQVDVETAQQFDDLKAQLPEAEAILTQAQKDTVAALPADSERYKTAARKVKTANFRLSQRVILAERFERAQKIYDEAKAYAAAGNQAIASQKFGEAIAAYQQVVEDARCALLPHSLKLAGYLNQLAQILQELGQCTQGIPLAMEAVQIAETRRSSRVKLANYQFDLAALFRLQGHYAEAESFYKSAIQGRAQCLEDSHLSIAQSSAGLGLLYQHQGRYGEAEPLLQRSLHIFEQQLGADHPDVATSLNNLAELYRAQGRYDEAEPLYLQAIEIGVKTLPDGHPSIAKVQSNFTGMIRAARAAGQTALLSEHPTTQAILQQLRSSET